MEQAYLDRLLANDEAAYGLGDTIDTKAGLALVVVVFLAEQTGSFLMARSSLTHDGLVAQWGAAFALALAGTCCIAAMWPRDFAAEDATDWDEWMQRLRHNHPGDDAAVSRAFFEGRVKSVKERIRDNRAICREKANLTHAAFWLSAVACGDGANFRASSSPRCSSVARHLDD
ncbi:MAG TPA: hypothetical protein VN700_07375 [Vicinamibacterales bacterium]|nr:hypothetical protein [Vicinamibacterales bacterium]